MRQPRLRTIALLGIGCLAIPGVASAQATPSDEPAAIDTAAIGALTRMGTYLGKLMTFHVRAEASTEEVIDDGQKVQKSFTAELVADRPTRMFLDVHSDRQNRQIYYDGKTFTLWAPRLNYYATVPAPATIIALVDTLDAKYDLETPLADLFRWATPEPLIRQITDAKVIGSSQVDGVTTEQYAFRQEGLDWQIWIQKGEYPLPRKVVLTTLTDDARPQYTATYTWNLAPSFNDASFVFVVPANAQRIRLAEIADPDATPSTPGGAQ
jgi:hypothetical protein